MNPTAPAGPNPNVDATELGKFADSSSRWWDLDGDFRPLHQINPLRAQWIDERASLSGKRVLDVGCGGGILSEAMASRGAEVTGIDLAEAALSVARLHALDTGVSVEYRLIPAETLAAQAPGEFDVVTCLEMLEHVPDPGSTVRACAQLVRPGGQLFFSTLNRNPKSWLFAIAGAEYVLGLLPRGTHNWQRFITPAELSLYARSAGIDIKEMTGLVYNPITRRYRLDSHDIDVNYMACATRSATPGEH